MHIVYVLLQIIAPKWCCECATPPSVQQPVIGEQNHSSASTQKGVRCIKKGIKVQTLFFMFI